MDTEIKNTINGFILDYNDEYQLNMKNTKNMSLFYKFIEIIKNVIVNDTTYSDVVKQLINQILNIKNGIHFINTVELIIKYLIEQNKLKTIDNTLNMCLMYLKNIKKDDKFITLQHIMLKSNQLPGELTTYIRNVIDEDTNKKIHEKNNITIPILKNILNKYKFVSYTSRVDLKTGRILGGKSRKSHHRLKRQRLRTRRRHTHRLR